MAKHEANLAYVPVRLSPCSECGGPWPRDDHTECHLSTVRATARRLAEARNRIFLAVITGEVVASSK